MKMIWILRWVVLLSEVERLGDAALRALARDTVREAAARVMPEYVDVMAGLGVLKMVMPLEEMKARLAELEVRAAAPSLADVVREQGGDPTAHWDEYAADLAELDRRGIILDSDPRKNPDEPKPIS